MRAIVLFFYGYNILFSFGHLKFFFKYNFFLFFFEYKIFSFWKRKKVVRETGLSIFPRGCRGLIRGPLGTLIFEPAQELIHQPLKLAHLTRLWRSRMQKKRKGMFINLYA